jgi:acyl-CoA reductase-like NAD-dependent aldehyde dehydrogenase
MIVLREGRLEVPHAEDSQYGLTAAMFTNDTGLAWQVGERLRVGSFTVNSTGGVLGQPFAATSARARDGKWAPRVSASGPRPRC